MSKQIRVDNDAYEFLERLAAKHRKPISDCASQVFDVFETFVDEIENDGRVVIESAKGRLFPVSSLLKPRRGGLQRVETGEELRALLDDDDEPGSPGVSRP